MKKLTIFLGTVLCAALVSGCQHRSNEHAGKALDSVSEEEMERVDTAAQVAEKDHELAVKAADGGMTEVDLGKIAQQQATAKEVKNFATMMVADHSKANNELKALASTKNMTLPSSPSQDKQQTINELSAKSGAAFDKGYVAEMVKAHKTDIALFEEAAKTVQDAELKHFFENTLPVLKTHMEHIESVQKQIK